MEPQRMLVSILEEIVGEGLLEEELRSNTLICYDLELESIEVVALLELLAERLGVVPDVFGEDRSLDADKLDALTFGDLLEQLKSRVPPA